MIKIISYVVIAFFYRKANILHRWSNILRFFNGNKGLCQRLQISLIWMKTCIASRGLWAVAILKSLLCLSAGPLQESYGFSIYQHTAFCVFFNWLTTCTYWTAQWLGHCWRGLTQTELADWQYESGNTNTDLKLTQTAATQYTRSTLPTNSTLLAAPASTMAEELHPQQLSESSHDDTICGRNAT